MIFNKVRKKGNLFLFGFILSLFFISLVSAQPPPSTQTNVNIEVGLQIQTQGIGVLKQNTPHFFQFHVYNISTGLNVNNITTNCTFHLYNKTGASQYESNNLDFGGGSFEIDLTANNFTELGIYSYYVHCNATSIGGFSREVFEVTPTGFTNLLGFYFIILGISLVFLIIGFWIKDPWVVIFGTFGLFFVGLYILLNGIDGIRNLAYTRAIAFIIIGVAAYISIKAGISVGND